MKCCAIIPSYNHHRVIDAVIAQVRQQGLPVFVIDDGSAEATRLHLAALHAPDAGITVHRLATNQGKGAAVMTGFALAQAAGFTHAVQIDADGQHDLESLPALLALAQAHPEALISGQPIYDASVPKARKIGRYVTHVWVWIETGSLRIRDSMCGFRVYPLAPVMALLATRRIGHYMDFDTDIMVRLFWRGTDVVQLPVRVIYPPENSSNFRILRDNWRITHMHTRLVIEMLWNLRRIRRTRPRTAPSAHWATLREVGTGSGIRFCAATYRLLGRRGVGVVLAPVALYFYLTRPAPRAASRQFLTAARGTPPRAFAIYRHFYQFARRAAEVFGAWTGTLPASAIHHATPEGLAALTHEAHGALILISHVGNADLARALLPEAMRARMTILVHTHHAEQYNRTLRHYFPQAAMNLLQITDITPTTVIALQDRLARGEWICIAGDRTAVMRSARVSTLPFLGAPAPFAQGPWILASLLGCPIYMLSAMAEGAQYQLRIEKLADRLTLPRHGREEALQHAITPYAHRLEALAKTYPFQWFNFFDFWKQ